MKRFAIVSGVCVLLVACSSGPGAAPSQGSVQTPQAPPPAVATPPAAATSGPIQPGQPTANAPQPGGGGDNESRARALIPQGASELAEYSVGNAYTVQVTSTQSLEQLGAFWSQAVPAAGLQESGRFTMGDTLTIAFTNPDGGIVASRDTSSGSVIITISVGTT